MSNFANTSLTAMTDDEASSLYNSCREETIAEMRQRINQHDNMSASIIRFIDENGRETVVYREDMLAHSNYFRLDEVPINPTGWLEEAVREWADNEYDSRLAMWQWGLQTPAEGAASESQDGSVLIVVERKYYGYSPIGYLTAEGTQEPQEFASCAEAAKWISQQDGQPYYLAHGEAGRPTYTIVAA